MDRRKRAIDAYKRMRDQPDAAVEQGGFTKTGRSSRSNPSVDRGTPREPGAGVSDVTRLIQGAGHERAARLLIALGAERAAEIMKHLDEREVETIARAIAATPGFRRSELDAVLEETTRVTTDVPLHGGPDVARQMLAAAFGQEEGERRFFRAVPDAPAIHFQFLNDLEPAQLAAVIKDESPAAAALILSHVNRELAAQVITRLPVGERAAIARRIARMGKLNREVISRVEETVREKIRRQGRQVTQGVDGPGTLAAILRHMAPASAGAVLEDLGSVHHDLSESIRQKLYTTELMLELSDRHLGDLMREFSDREIAIFLKGKDEQLRARVLRAVSERRAFTVSEEYAHLGPQRREDVERVTAEVLERMRELEDDGSILVPREGDRYI